MTRPDRFIGDIFTFSADRDGPSGDWDAYRTLYETGGEVLREAEDFHADIAAFRVDRAILFERRLRGVRHERRAEHLSQTGFDHFTLHLNLGGTIDVDAGHGFQPLADGAAILLDAALPMRLRLVDVHLITASLARGQVLATSAIGHGYSIAPERTATLREHLAETKDDATGRLNLADPRVLMQMLTTLAPDKPGERRLRRRIIQRAVIRNYVESRLDQRTLDPATIACGCGISRPTLYRLTEPDGGVSSFVRKVRLARLEHVLAEGQGEPLADIAETLGFADGNHMSRQFRAVTGVSPGLYRSRSKDDVAGGPARRRWAAWMAEFQ